MVFRQAFVVANTAAVLEDPGQCALDHPPAWDNFETGKLVTRAQHTLGYTIEIVKRSDVAATGDLGHIEFLQVLCHDEIARRESQAIARRIRRAHFEQQVTLEEFDFAASPKLPAAQIRDLAALRWLPVGESVVLYGLVGVRRTHVAQGLGHLAIRQGAEVRSTKTSRLLAMLAGGYADRTWDKRLREFVHPPVLILDDFGMRELTATQADDLYELISKRSTSGGSLILTSNRSPVDWYPLSRIPMSQSHCWTG